MSFITPVVGYLTSMEGLAVIGTGLAAYSSYQAGVTAKQQAEQKAAFARYNAQVAARQAEAEREAARSAAEVHRRKSRIFMAHQRVLYGKSGVASRGSPLLVMEDTAEQLQLERGRILAKGFQRAGAYRQQSILDTMTAKAYQKGGQRAYTSGLLSGAGDIIEGRQDYVYKKSVLES